MPEAGRGPEAIHEGVVPLSRRAPNEDAPAWVCEECILSAGDHRRRLCRWDWGLCGVCGRHRVVVRPQDFGLVALTAGQWRQLRAAVHQRIGGG